VRRVISQKIVGSLLGVASCVALLLNWATMIYFGLQRDPGSLHIWWPLAAHPTAVFALVMAVGVLCGVVAGINSSKAWFVLAALNAGSFFFEWLAS
jgi:hypothetical protein